MAYQQERPYQSQPFSSTSSQVSSSEPFAPQYLDQAAQQTQDLVASAQQSATAQKQRLADYINHLYSLQALSKMAAKGAAARGAAGQQNPLAVYKAMNDLAAQAGVPMDAEISKALQQGDNIENTLNTMLANAANVYAHLGSVMQQHSAASAQSQSGQGGGGTAKVGGGSNGGDSRSGQLQRMDPIKDLGGMSAFVKGAKLPPGFDPAEGSGEQQQDDLTQGRDFTQDLTPEEQAGFGGTDPGQWSPSTGNPYDVGPTFNSDFSGSGAGVDLGQMLTQGLNDNMQSSQQLPGFFSFQPQGGGNVMQEMPAGFDFNDGAFMSDFNFGSDGSGAWAGQDYSSFAGAPDSTNEFSGFADSYSSWV